MKVISVMSPKGGVGKTTTAIHLAGYFLKAGRSVVLIDSDQQGSSSDFGATQKLSPPLPCISVRAESLQNVLGTLPYSLAIIDSAGKLDSALVVATLKLSDLVIMPIKPSMVDLKAIRA